MPTYRFRKTGHFMGKYYNAGDEVELFEKQAKYALMSGQLEEAFVHSTAKSSKKGQDYNEQAEETTVDPTLARPKDADTWNPKRVYSGSQGLKPRPRDSYAAARPGAVPKGHTDYGWADPKPGTVGRSRSERFSRRKDSGKVSGSFSGKVKE